MTGSYYVFFITPTMTNPEKIQFNNSQGYTDTFL